MPRNSDMHGLIFETSISLLAGSTRLKEMLSRCILGIEDSFRIKNEEVFISMDFDDVRSPQWRYQLENMTLEVNEQQFTARTAGK